MRQFSSEHVAALAITVLAATLAATAPQRRPGRWVEIASRALALAIAAAYATEYVANLVLSGFSLDFSLPLQLTDAVTFAAVVALWAPRPLAVELLYFWALTASLQALLTPDLNRTFPSLFYFTYFATHSGAVVAASLLVIGRRLVPRAGAARRAFAATAAFAALAGLIDAVAGANYMFLRAKPQHASLLDDMGPWPVYVAAGVAVAIAMFGALEALASALRRAHATAP